MKIVADDKILYIHGVLEDYATVLYKKGDEITSDDVKGADALLVRTRTRCDEKLLKGSNVKLVGTATIGTDHLDIPWMEENQIEWVNAPGCNSGSVKQYIASVLAHLILEGVKPSETTIGIVGVGMVGSKINQLAKALGFKVLLNDPPRARREGSEGFCSLKELLSDSQIITFHTPLNMEGEDKTYHLLDDNALSLIQPGAVVINSSRGEVTKTETLLKGVNEGIISKLVVDVWENEPAISLELLDKVWVGTPHIAGYSADGKANGSTAVIQALSRKFNLPTADWKPMDVPMPESTLLTPAQPTDTPLQKIARGLLQTYDLLSDSERLRKSPQDFEQQRGSYPVRREFHIWKVDPNGGYGAEALEILKELEFTLI